MELNFSKCMGLKTKFSGRFLYPRLFSCFI
jgi:hypothetical protein